MPEYRGTAGDDTLQGTSGADVYYISNGSDSFNGLGGRDKAIVYLNETHGGPWHDIWVGVDEANFGFGAGDTSISNVEELDFRGSSGRDVVLLTVTGLDDYRLALDGGTGEPNRLSLTVSGDLALVGDLGTGSFFDGRITFTNFQDIDVELGSGNDSLVLNAASNHVSGRGGDDTLWGRAGDDTLTGDRGADTLHGEGGDDSLYAWHGEDDEVDNLAEIDRLFGGAGNDFLDIGYGDFADGGTDRDMLRLRLEAVPHGVSLDFSSLIAGTPMVIGGGTISSIESIYEVYGTQFADAIRIGSGGVQGDSRLLGHGGDDVLEGGDGQDLLDGGVGNDLLRGGKGHDTLQGGTGNDTLYGGAGNDRLEGGIDVDLLYGEAGDDRLDGGVAADSMTGGAGNDVYVVDNAGDTVVEIAGGGTDRIETSASSFALSANVEHLVGTGWFGQSLAGNDAANLIDGGMGADIMDGKGGNDVYMVDNAGDRVLEAAGGGLDEVHASATWAIETGAEVEKLVLAGTGDIDAYGNELANLILGNSGSNILLGFAGNDDLQGDAGIDALYGGAGADLLSGGGDEDVFAYLEWTDSGGASVDTIRDFQTGFDKIDLSFALSTSVSWTLSGTTSIVTVKTLRGDMTINVEGTVKSTDFNLTEGMFIGTANADTLTGTVEDDVLFGGLGADSMTGLAGSDHYFVDQAGDKVVEAADEGTDSVEASISYILPANVEILLMLAGSIDGTGNALDNFILGNDAANLINGRAGNDEMHGLGGNDIYVFDSGQDKAIEVAGGGYDVVRSTANVSLHFSAQVEELVLLGPALTGSGNDLDNLIIGNALDNGLSGLGGVDTLVGGLGDDTYGISDGVDIIVEEADGGIDTVNVFGSYTMADNLERLYLAYGFGDFEGTGNDLDNTMFGNDGDNMLDGAGGADYLFGGHGNDVFFIDQAGDEVVENEDQGDDLVNSAVSYALGANLEHVTLNGAANVNATGNAYANRLTGNAGTNLLNGGGGADAMAGGAGNDTYVVSEAGDLVLEAAAEGTDLVRSSIAYTLDDNVEQLVLLGAAGLSGTGNGLANLITGNAGDNLLDGGAGADVMEGGDGSDVYIVDNSRDRVVESSAAGGTDHVRSTASFVLGANVERLTLTAAADVNGTGNGLANVLTGNDGSNVLDGGIGADTMIGGGGNDVFVVDNVADRISDTAGVDLVRSSIDLALGVDLEKLVLTGTGNRNGTGNALANTLTGNGGNNILDGKTGADGMAGGDGNDVYVIDHVGDRVSEASATGGIDLVKSLVSFELGDNVEKLTLTGGADTNATGNALANTLIGNIGMNILKAGAGDDRLDGGADDDRLHGGAGSDILTGGTGKDRFYFDAALGRTTNFDDITDFTAADDTIFLSRTVFAATPLGTLSASAFVAGTAAQDADDRIIYNAASGNILFDADGSGAGAAVAFAHVDAGTVLTSTDFFVF